MFGIFGDCINPTCDPADPAARATNCPVVLFSGIFAFQSQVNMNSQTDYEGNTVSGDPC
jgi:hypothetical protein